MVTDILEIHIDISLFQLFIRNSINHAREFYGLLAPRGANSHTHLRRRLARHCLAKDSHSEK